MIPLLLCNPNNDVIVRYVKPDWELIRQLFRWLDDLDLEILGEVTQQFSHCKRIDRSRLSSRAKGKFIDKLASDCGVKIPEVAPKHFKDKQTMELKYWIRQKSTDDMSKNGQNNQFFTRQIQIFLFI